MGEIKEGKKKQSEWEEKDEEHFLTSGDDRSRRDMFENAFCVSEQCALYAQ